MVLTVLCLPSPPPLPPPPPSAGDLGSRRYLSGANLAETTILKSESQVLFAQVPVVRISVA